MNRPLVRGIIMIRRCFLVALLPGGCLAIAVTLGRAQNPADAPATRENIEAALKLTQAAAAEYEFRVGDDGKPLELQSEPVLKWSNPDRGEVHGNVFLWTRDGRPLVVGALFKWFSPMTHMAHEFHSFAEEPLRAKFHGVPVWKTSEAGLRFVDVPKAAVPAGNEAQRILQLKQLAKDFAGSKKKPDGDETEVRLLPQPIHRYAAPKQGILNGGLFAFVEGTDPEIFLLIEARGENAANARWQFAATRMVAGEEVRLRHRDQQVWAAEILPWKDIFVEHERVYTTFRFKEIPDFLKDALPKPKP
jgi:hypothetical protein